MTAALLGPAALLAAFAAAAQTPPTAAEKQAYTGLHAAAARGDVAQVSALTAKGEKADRRDRHGRTPLHVAAYERRHDVMKALVSAGASE